LILVDMNLRLTLSVEVGVQAVSSH